MIRRLTFAAVAALLASGGLIATAAPASAGLGTWCVVTSPDPDGRRVREICVTF